MPELPEVENARLSLQSLGFVGQTLTQIELRRKGLRVPFPSGLAKRLKGQTFLAVHRRAKYLLFETEDFFLLSHLGMTGSWRTLSSAPRKKHDHIVLHFSNGLEVAYNDPRRFGLLDLVRKKELAENRWLKHLGVEPLAAEFDSAYLFSLSRKMKGSIKAFLMDQKRVVGVGNIYASEVLFAAAMKPTRAAGRISKIDAEKLVVNIRRILGSAIAAGGSTIRDYRNSRGEAGSFQDQHLVYDRAGEPCRVCTTRIRSQPIAGRSTFWCPQCQR